MAEAKRDGNYIPTLLGVSSSDGLTPVPLWADPTTHRLLVDLPSGTGDVTGPASSTDNAIVRFDSTTGKIIQNSVVTIADTTGVIAGTEGVTLSGTTSGTTALIATAIAGTTTITLPAASDTLVGKATTDTLTNKTIDQDGTGNNITNIANTSIKASAAIAVDKLAAITASEIVITDGSGFISSAAVATYPSLTELTYVKGVTSAIQTQIGTKLPLAGGTMTGDITLGENTSIALDPAGSADGKYSGITVTGTGGATIAFGDVVYLAAADSRWELTDASAVGTAGTVMVGIAVTSSTDGTAITVLLNGIIRADANFPTLTISAPVYISETASEITNTAPTTADAVVRVLGFGLTANEMYFNPSPDHITVTG